MTVPEPDTWTAKYVSKALLGYLLDTRLAAEDAGHVPADRDTAFVPSAWDAWWACYRSGTPLSRTGLRVQAGESNCPECSGQAALLAVADPPEHPGTGSGPCGCLLRWAAAMRAPGPAAAWPPWALSLALIKPGAPAGDIQGMLGAWFEVLAADQFVLTTADTRRLYPEAYGADYVADRDAYLTSAPVRCLTLLARDPGVNSKDIKARVRRELGDGNALRNVVHMPDNPGEAFADIAQFSGYHALAALYRRYDRDHAPARLAFYRAALGISDPGADRVPAAG